MLSKTFVPNPLCCFKWQQIGHEKPCHLTLAVVRVRILNMLRKNAFNLQKFFLTVKVTILAHHADVQDGIMREKSIPLTLVNTVLISLSYQLFYVFRIEFALLAAQFLLQFSLL